MPTPMIASKKGALHGTITVPGDKSISHRALIFGALAKGVTKVQGLLEADDVLRTAAALRALGASIEKEGEVWHIKGAPWQSPSQGLYAGNSGTGVRLLMGAVAGQGVGAHFDGDRSLRSRPMGRILDPLAELGAVATAEGGRLPVTMKDADLKAIHYTLPKPSAQIKSAIMLAALGAEGTTVIDEPIPSRDHTERMLPAFGVPLDIDESGNCRRLSVKGPVTLTATSLSVPADPSSAAFPVAAALIVPGSEVTVTGVLTNPFRIGLYETLKEMGAQIELQNTQVQGGEPVADLHVKQGALKGVTVPAARAPSMIDEYPI
ncbi:MAG: 3-phosphoshikimate 1-carboxyvinyltransferase, partial [Pseudomonadota bacterium]